MSFVWVLAALAAPSPGVHATATSSLTLSFEEVLAAAERAPTLEASSRAIAAKSALDAALGALPGNPELKVSPGLRFYGDRSADFEPAISLLQPIDLSGATRARGRAAARETSAMRADLDAATRSVRLDAARAWIALWATERGLASSIAEHALAAELVTLARRALAGGVATSADLQEAVAFEAELELQTLTKEGELFERTRAVAELVRLAPDARLATRGELPSRDLTPSAVSDALTAIDALPELVAAREAATAEAEHVRELEAANGLRGAVGVTVARDAPDSVLALADLVVVLPVFERGERERATASARARHLEGAHAAARERARQRLAVVFHEVSHTREVEGRARTKLVPALRELVRLREAELRAGSATIEDVLRARRAAITAERALLETSADRALAEVHAGLVLDALEGTTP